MEYEIDAVDQDAGWFSGAHDKVAKKFKQLSEKRNKDGWELHSFDTVVQGKTMAIIICWKR